MKNKFLILLMCVFLCFSCAACDNTRSENVQTPAGTDLSEPNASQPEETPSANEELPEEQEPEESGESVPTVTPPETEKPSTPAPKTETLVCATATSLNVRAGAGTSYEIIGALDKNDMAMPVQKAGSWSEILFKVGL